MRPAIYIRFFFFEASAIESSYGVAKNYRAETRCPVYLR